MSFDVDDFLRFTQKDLDDDNVLYTKSDIVRDSLNTKFLDYKKFDETKSSIKNRIKENKTFIYADKTLYLNIGCYNKSFTDNYEKLLPLFHIDVDDSNDNICSYIKILKNADDEIINNGPKYLTTLQLMNKIVNLDTDKIYTICKSMSLEFLYFVNKCYFWLWQLSKFENHDHGMFMIDTMSIEILDNPNIVIINCEYMINRKKPRYINDFNFKYHPTSNEVTLYSNTFTLTSDVNEQEYYIRKYLLHPFLKQIRYSYLMKGNHHNG